MLELRAAQVLHGSGYSIVEGTVGNTSGADLLLLSVEVLVPDGNGNVVTLGVAPLANSPLSPGKESTFVCIIKARIQAPSLILDFRDAYGQRVPALDVQSE